MRPAAKRDGSLLPARDAYPASLESRRRIQRYANTAAAKPQTTHNVIVTTTTGNATLFAVSQPMLCARMTGTIRAMFVIAPATDATQRHNNVLVNRPMNRRPRPHRRTRHRRAV